MLLQGFGMSPLVSLYYFAPIVLACNLLVILPIEGLEAFWLALELGPAILLSNALCTFFLNLASVWLIGKASGLTLTLSGVLKDSEFSHCTIRTLSSIRSPPDLRLVLLPGQFDHYPADWRVRHRSFRTGRLQKPGVTQGLASLYSCIIQRCDTCQRARRNTPCPFLLFSICGLLGESHVPE
jgi:hypothetical protein